MDVSKRDWKLFREKLPHWQEAYMERLVREYIEYLSGTDVASIKFHELEKRIKIDRKRPGVNLWLEKSEVPYDICRLINDGVIDYSDLSEFSSELQEFVKNYRELRWSLEEE